MLSESSGITRRPRMNVIPARQAFGAEIQNVDLRTIDCDDFSSIYRAWLDHSVLLYGSGLSDGNIHLPENIPVIVAGKGSGTLKGGQHLKYPQDSRHGELILTLLQRNELPVKSIGDGTEGLSEV